MASGNPNPAAQYLAKAIPTLPSGPAPAMVAVTLSDTVDDTAGPFRAFVVTVTGDVTWIDLEGNTNTQTAVAANTLIRVGATRFKLATTATVKGLW